MILYKDDAASDRAFVEDSDYVFKAVATLSVYNGETQVESEETSNIRTHPTPLITHIDEIQIESVSLSEYESWRVYTRAAVVLGASVSQNAPEFTFEAPTATGVQVKVLASQSCAWGNSARSPAPFWKTAGSYHYLARYGIGDGSSQLRVKARAVDNGTSYPLDTYTATLKPTWHQADHVVKYRLGTPIPTPTPRPGYISPHVVDVPEAVRTAIAIWTTAVPQDALSFCVGDSCPDGMGSETIAISVATPLPTPTPPVRKSPSLISNCLPAIACVEPWRDPPHIGNQNLHILHPALWYKYDDKSRTYMVKEVVWANITRAAWDTHKDNPYRYLPMVIAHELGHAAGLGHSTNPDDVMYERIQFQTSLTSDDIEAMKSNYEGHRPHR